MNEPAQYLKEISSENPELPAISVDLKEGIPRIVINKYHQFGILANKDTILVGINETCIGLLQTHLTKMWHSEEAAIAEFEYQKKQAEKESKKMEKTNKEEGAK